MKFEKTMKLKTEKEISEKIGEIEQKENEIKENLILKCERAY